jgi:3-isopropylmalate/(R)-2-methylmalate dehydratase small subunit
MRAFTTLTGKVMPLDRANVDTDAIIPKQYLKSIRRAGFGPFLFDDWRYLDPGSLEIDPATRRVNPNFVLNQHQHAGASILLARQNFGCGSSREHAVWAIEEFGFRCVIASSFADIFFTNCFSNGVLPIVLSAEQVQTIFALVSADPGAQITVDLPQQHVLLPDGQSFTFDIDPTRKDKLVRGLDAIGETLQKADAIRAYEARRSAAAPWLFQ